MKFSIRFADKIVGTLVILALAILIFVVFMLGSNQRWFARDMQYYTLLPSASGVSENMAITYKGFTIGRVKKIGLTEKDQVKIIFTIFEEYTERVTYGSIVEVMSSPIPMLGSGFIFHFSKSKDPVAVIDDEEIPFIPEKSSAEAKVYIANGLLTVKTESGFDINNIINQVTGLLESINTVLSGNEGYQDIPLGAIINDISKITANIAQITEDLKPVLPLILDDVKIVTDGISSPTGTVMTALDGEGPIYKNLENTLTSVAGIVQNLNETTKFIPTQLPQVAVLIGELNTAMMSVQDILTSLLNNPLLKGGVPQRVESGPGGASPRNQDFRQER